MIKHSRRPVATGGALLAAALVCIAAVPWSDTQAQASAPAIDLHLLDSGGKTLANPCYRLSGTIGQAAPGYSSSATYSIDAGFLAATPKTNRDEIFFNSFEGC
ncbi:MAG TPA: hypothetical protein VHW73_11245 [Rudaea sp.]|jgi:hypothetical protein|nr:hypothetical protein [Rudaea sp.]